MYVIFMIKQQYLEKNCWNLLIWVTGHCNRAAVSRNRYGVEKTVDTHKILINAIKFYAIELNSWIVHKRHHINKFWDSELPQMIYQNQKI